MLWGIQIQKPNAQQKGDLSTRGNMSDQNEKASGEAEGKTQSCAHRGKNGDRVLAA